MQKPELFKFTTQQLKKINHMLPKGYKFIIKQQYDKRQSLQLKNKKKQITTQVVSNTQQSIQNNNNITKAKQKIKQQYSPTKKSIQNAVTIVPTPPQISIHEQPALSSYNFLQKVKRYQVYNLLMNVNKSKQTQIILKDIQQKVGSLGQTYKISQFNSDLTAFCHMIYTKYAKTSNQYRYAAALQNYLVKLMTSQNQKTRKNQVIPLNYTQSQSSYNKKKSAPLNRIYQPLSQNKLPSPSQKRLLGQMIKKLPSESLQQVCYIIFQSTQNKEYIFDLDTLHVKKFRQLQQYVKKCMQKTGEWQMRNYQDQQFSNQSIFVIEHDRQQTID